MVNFLKNLNIIILSVCLLNFSTSAVLADVKVTEGQLKTDSTGKKSKEVEYQFDKVQQKSLLATITMLAAGAFLARAIVLYKPMTLDVKVAAVAGAAFFAGEILSNIQIKKELDAISLKVTKGKTDQAENQIQSFMDLKEGYQKVQKSLKTKKTLQTAAAAGFAGAAAASLLQIKNSYGKLKGCHLAIQEGVTAANACQVANATSNTAEAALCTTCGLSLTAMSKTLKTYTSRKDLTTTSSATSAANLEALHNSILKMPEVCKGKTSEGISSKVKTGCMASAQEEKKNSRTASADVKISKSSNIENNNLIYNKSLLILALKLLVNQTYASWLPTVAGLGAAATVMFAKNTKIMSEKFDPMLVTPTNRAIVWGALSAMSFAATSALNSVIKELEERIKKIDEIIAELQKFESGIMDQKGILATDEGGFIKSINGGVTGLDTGTDFKTQCLDSNSTANCASVSAGIQKSIQAETNLPDGLKSLMAEVGKLGDGLGGVGDISGSTLASAEGLAGKHAAIRNQLNKLLDDNKKLTGQDLKAESDKLQNGMLSGIGKTLNQGGYTPSGFLSSIGGIGGAASGQSADGNTEEAKEELVASIPAEMVSGEGSGDSSVGADDFNFAGSTAEGEFASTEGEDPIYTGEIPEDSIGKANGPGLFEILTIRYMKSGYPRLLEVEEETK